MKAEPTVIDTGTIYAETKICSNCGAPIERAGPKPARTERAARAWIHKHNRSASCYGRGGRQP